MQTDEHNNTGPPPQYMSFLLRIWRHGSSDDWLASTEATRTHEHHSFHDLNALFAYLQAITDGRQTTEDGRHRET